MNTCSMEMKTGFFTNGLHFTEIENSAFKTFSEEQVRLQDDCIFLNDRLANIGKFPGKFKKAIDIIDKSIPKAMNGQLLA